jgi:hypothetical protein
MTFARLILEIRHRVAALPDARQRTAAIERIARDILTEIPESDPMRRILATFLGLGDGDEFDASLLDQMTPELVLKLVMIASELLELERRTSRRILGAASH